MSDDDEDFVIRHIIGGALVLHTYGHPDGPWLTDIDISSKTAQRFEAPSQKEAVKNHRKALREAGPYIAFYATGEFIARGHKVTPATEIFGEDTPECERDVLVAVCGEVLTLPAGGPQSVTCIACAGTLAIDPRED